MAKTGHTAKTGDRPAGRAGERPSPAEFVRQVRQELNKVTWPTRKETAITTAVVLVMAFIAAAFFFAVDQVIALGVRLLLGLGG
jgi:preprotein translocase subunit SecE